ncbi:MAG TPA: gamma-glutamyltransferase [Kofleriaceae bacterium]|jgi:gamma-glutamyltranspeptidase/glutathione hydrolase
MLRFAGVALVALVACHREPPPPPPPAPPTAASAPAVDTPKPEAKPIYRGEKDVHFDPALSSVGKTYMVVSEGPLATQVGHDILADGGNAADAAVATAFALAVVHPTAGNLAGGGFAIIRTAPGQATALDFRETAPAAATSDMFVKGGKKTNESVAGDKAVGVPGSVAGLYALHKKYGKKPWADVVAPAIKLAREGFAVDQKLHEAIVRRAVFLVGNEATGAIWVPNRMPVKVGATVYNPSLADTLERIQNDGPDGFYKGQTAADLVKEMQAHGGLITAADLAGYQPVWRDVLRFHYRDYVITAMPPPSSGGVAMAMVAGILEHVELGKLPWYGAEHVHWLAETWRRAFAARNEILGDPSFVKDMPLDKLVSSDYAAKLYATITPKATPSTEIPGLIEGNHTTNLCVVDADGMAIAMTTTLNLSWGNGVTVDGFLLNNEMDDFAAQPGQPNTFGLVQGTANRVEPGKRMLSSMSPSIVESAKGDLVMLAGAGGGPRIITAVWQTISNVIDFGKGAAQAVDEPRVHHQHLPDTLYVESLSIDGPTETDLRARGYKLDWGSDYFGSVTAIVRTKGGGWEGAADPRGGGKAQGD